MLPGIHDTGTAPAGLVAVGLVKDFVRLCTRAGKVTPSLQRCAWDDNYDGLQLQVHGQEHTVVLVGECRNKLTVSWSLVNDLERLQMNGK